MSNTGLPMCVQTQKVIKKSIFVNLVANDGTLNYLDPSTTLSLAAMTALINNADTSKRYYPTPEMKNVDAPKDAPKMEEWKDGSKFFIREGVRTFTGVFADCPPLYKGKLESLRCNSNIGKFDIDIEGNVMGLTNGTDGKLYPIPVAVQSVFANVKYGTDDATQQIEFSYEIPSTVQDANFRMIGRNAFTDYNPVNIGGLIDVYYKKVSLSATVLVVDIYLPSPDLGALVPFQGLLSADFISYVTSATAKIRNVTGSADVTVVAAESASVPGRYTLTFTSTPASTLILDGIKSGYDFIGFLTGEALVTP